jgi:hypothetical protein
VNQNQPGPHSAASRPDPVISRRPVPADPIDPTNLDALFAGIEAEVGLVLTALDWAEDEIAAASHRHRTQADLLFHSLGVLMPRHIGTGMNTEFVYRAHARELLERVAAGEDLRPATAAEICLTLSRVSQHAPMHGAAAGLYFRMWLAAFPDHPLTPDQADNQRHYEHLYGPQIDELEAMIRRKAADPDRQLGDIECDGRHHGTTVACRFTSSRPPSP